LSLSTHTPAPQIYTFPYTTLFRSRVPEHDRQPRSEAPGGELHTPDLRRRHDVPGDADHKQISKPLPEHELGGNARIGATQDDGERLLPPLPPPPLGQREPMGLPQRGIGVIHACDEPTVAFSQPRECFGTRDHGALKLASFRTSDARRARR